MTRTRAAPERLRALVREVSAAHRKVRSRWLVRDVPGATPLEETLSAAGYAPSVPTRACAIGVGEYRLRPAKGIEVRPVSDMAGLRDCIAVMAAAFPGGRGFSEEELEGTCATARGRKRECSAS